MSNYIVKITNFTGNIEEEKLPQIFQESPSENNIYIVSNNGLFLFDSKTNSCNKIATSKFINKSEHFQAIIAKSLKENEPFLLDPKEASQIEALTKVGYILEGLPVDTDPLKAMYELSKALISREDNSLLETLAGLSNIQSSGAILSIFKGDKQNCLFDIRELKGLTPGQEYCRMFAYNDMSQALKALNIQGIVDPNMALTSMGIVDLFHQHISSKTSYDIALYFARLCEKIFNDSVSGEKWEAFINRALSAKAEAPRLQM